MSGPNYPRHLLRPALAALCLVVAMHSLAAADYPERPIRLLLPFPAGGAVDLVARLMTARMAEELGRPFVIENKTGAGGVIATDATAKAAPDGYTLLLTSPNHTINAAINPKLPYDTRLFAGEFRPGPAPRASTASPRARHVASATSI